MKTNYEILKDFFEKIQDQDLTEVGYTHIFEELNLTEMEPIEIQNMFDFAILYVKHYSYLYPGIKFWNFIEKFREVKQWLEREHYKNTYHELSCDGCKFQKDCPSSIHCIGCARMYTDNYRKKED